MHARMTVAHAQPDRFDEAVAAVQEAFVPAAREQPGYLGFLLLTDRDQLELVGISFWETEADLQTSGGGAATTSNGWPTSSGCWWARRRRRLTR